MTSTECFKKAADVLDTVPEISRTHGFKAASVRVAAAREWRMLGQAIREGEKADG